MCKGNHGIAKAVRIGIKDIDRIVREFDGELPVDLGTVSKDLHAMVLSNELRYFAVQAYTSTIHAMWALMFRKNRYELLAPESMPSPALLREAQWRPVLFRRHLVSTLDEQVLACADLTDGGDPAHRWEPAVPVEGPERRSGVVLHMPHKARLGVVRSRNGSSSGPVELDLTWRDARSYAHCRVHHTHPSGEPKEKDCARLHTGESVTYLPMQRLPVQIPVAFLTSRATPPARAHLSGAGLTPAR